MQLLKRLASQRVGAVSAIAGLAALGVAALPGQAHAWWHVGIGIALPPVVVAPAPVYVPPPVYYAPPPVAYYAPPPPPQRPWVPAHWENGYWVPGHWA
jgi:hypothetical protein